jgi:pyrroloquinoline quinone (PQQ) biosynthesis protein C
MVLFQTHLWVDKKTGGGIYEEMYDANGKMFRTFFKDYQIYNVNNREYASQVLLECKDLRSGHRTVIVNSDISYDKGLSRGYLHRADPYAVALVKEET